MNKQKLDKMTDMFFSKRICDRCGADLKVRSLSWFDSAVICKSCITEEMELRKALRNEGTDPGELEGCGYIPKLKSMEKSNG